MIEFLNLLILPIYWMLYKFHGRLTKVETQIDFLFEKNGGKKKDD